MSRHFIHHECSLFHPDAVEELGKLFDEREAMFDGPRSAIGSASDEFRLTWDWYKAWGHAAAVRVRPYELILFPPNVRRLTKSEHYVPWHQDAAYIQQMAQPHRQVATVYLPLDQGGAKVVYALGQWPRGPHLPMGAHGAGMPDFEPDEVLLPVLNVGDAMFFGDLVPHRTVKGSDDRPRRSIEFRLIMRKDAIPGKDYFDLRTHGQYRHQTPAQLEPT